MGSSQALWGSAVCEEVGRLISEPGNLSVHHRNVDVLSLTIAFVGPVVNGGHNGESSPHSCPNIGDGYSNFLRFPVRLSSNAHQTAYTLHYLVICGATTVRTCLTEPRYGAEYDSGIDLFNHVVTQPKSVHHSRGKILDYHVGIFCKLEENLFSFVVFEIKRQATFVAIY